MASFERADIILAMYEKTREAYESLGPVARQYLQSATAAFVQERHPTAFDEFFEIAKLIDRAKKGPQIDAEEVTGP